MIWRLILRNIVRNRKSNIIIILLIGSIAFLFFMGNSVIGRSVESMRDMYINGLTSDVVVQAAGDVTMNLFGSNMAVLDDKYFTMPELPSYEELSALIAADSRVDAATSQVSGRVALDFGAFRGTALLCGVDPATYFRLFPSIELIEGRFLDSGEFGVMLTLEKARAMENTAGVFPAPGESVLLTAGGGLGFKIREVPVVGVFRYKNAGQMMDDIVIADVQTARILSAIQVASSDVEASDGEVSLMGSSSIDDLFDDFFEGGAEEEEGGTISPDSLSAFLQEAQDDEPVADAGGGWNFIIMRLKKAPFRSADTFIADLNKQIAPYGAVAVNWQIAAGESATMLIILQALFNSGITLVSIVGVIAVINILLISILKRKREIGTLRSIGASDSFVRALFLGENFMLSLVSGAVGILSGAAFFALINSLRIPIPNQLIASLLGGHILHIEFFPQSAVLAAALAMVLGLVSSVYPVESAARMEPAAALRDMGA